MSLDPILWALKDAPVADSLERLVLVTLGERAARSDGCTAFPSRDTIAQTVMADSKTVQRVLQRLAKRGLIAKGDQSAARYIRADRRPTVYDLLIPYSWFPNPERMNEERRQAGLAPLTPEDRPDIAPPPEKKRRSDLGKARPKESTERGDSQSPREDGHGGTDSPARGDSESFTGGLEDPRTSSLIHPETLSPLPSPESSAPPVASSEREIVAAPEEQTPSRVEVPRQSERSNQDAAAGSRVVAAYAATLGRPVLNGTRAKLERQAVELLAAGLPEGWLADRAREMAPRGWTDLARHVERSTVPIPGQQLAGAEGDGVAPETRRHGLPAWCGSCGDGNPAAQFNVRFRTLDGAKCPDCHPDAVAA